MFILVVVVVVFEFRLFLGNFTESIVMCCGTGRFFSGSGSGYGSGSGSGSGYGS